MEIRTEGFEPIETRFPFEDIVPAQGVTYWELGYIQPEYYDSRKDTIIDTTQIVLFGGDLCRNSSNKDSCIGVFNAHKVPGTGFAPGCFPDYCYHLIKYRQNDEIRIANDSESIVVFLADIDSESDAILLALVSGYNYQINNVELGGIKPSKNGYFLIVNQATGGCGEPYFTWQILIHISTEGNIEELRRVVHSREEVSPCV